MDVVRKCADYHNLVSNTQLLSTFGIATRILVLT